MVPHLVIQTPKLDGLVQTDNAMLKGFNEQVGG